MSNFIEKYSTEIYVGIFAVIWASVGFYFIMSQPKSDFVKYNCSIAEISPDYPVSVKEHCRKLTSGRI